MNINKITTDTADNIKYDYREKPLVLPSGFAQLIAILSGVLIVLWVVLLVATSVSCAVSGAYECTSFSVALWSLPAIAGVVLTGLGVGVIRWVWLRGKSAEYLRIRGSKLHLDDIRAYTPQLIVVEALSARSEATAGLDALTLHTPASVTSVAHMPPERLLEVSEQSDLVIAPTTWLEWVDKQPHVLLSAQTGGGKSTTAKAIVSQRVKKDEDILVIDPHSSAWFDLPSVGGGEDWQEIKEAFQVVSNEYRSRLAERERYKLETGEELPHNYFKRLTVILDEANNTQAAISTRKKDTSNPWFSFMQTLGSGARKVGISVIILAQSSNVEDLEVSGPMRENFARIGCDDRVIKQIIAQDEKDNERRKQLYAALTDRQFPAVAEMNSRVYILDRTGLDKLSVTSASHCAWQGWTNTSSEAPEMPIIDVTPDTSIAGITDTGAVNEDVVIAYLLSKGKSANEIIDILGGNRNARLKQIKRMKGE